MTTRTTILAQAAVLMLVGLLLGVADGFAFRPVHPDRVKPPPLQEGSPSPVKQPEKPSEPKSPSTAPADSNSYTPTSKDNMPEGHITLGQAKELFDKSEATFVDTRAADLYDKGHVPGAYRIELHDFLTGTPDVLNLIPRDSNVVCYCIGGTCEESEAVAKMMTDSGYTKVYVMHDGFPGWQAMHFPVETGKGVQQ